MSNKTVICDQLIASEYAFVQYDEVLNHNNLPVDAVDKILGCIRLISERFGYDSDGRRPGKMYSMTPLDSFRVLVNVVRNGDLTKLPQYKAPYNKKLIYLLGSTQEIGN